MQGKTNFFETRGGEYQKANVTGTQGSGSVQSRFSLGEDF